MAHQNRLNTTATQQADAVSYLFVYGTLRPKTKHPMAKWLQRQAKIVGKATFQGKMYRIEDYPGVTASRSVQAQVTGDVLVLTGKNIEKTLQRLDEYEEYNPRDEKNSEFVRRRRKIQIEPNAAPIDCWIYLYNRRPKKNHARIADGEWQ